MADRSADRDGREVARLQAQSQERTNEGARRGADDDVGSPRIPAEVVLEGSKCSCVIGGADGATAPEHESDAYSSISSICAEIRRNDGRVGKLLNTRVCR